jgi:hypothetical protein
MGAELIAWRPGNRPRTGCVALASLILAAAAIAAALDQSPRRRVARCGRPPGGSSFEEGKQIGAALRGFDVDTIESRVRSVRALDPAARCHAMMMLEADVARFRPGWRPRRLAEIRRQVCGEMRAPPEIP